MKMSIEQMQQRAKQTAFGLHVVHGKLLAAALASVNVGILTEDEFVESARRIHRTAEKMMVDTSMDAMEVMLEAGKLEVEQQPAHGPFEAEVVPENDSLGG